MVKKYVVGLSGGIGSGKTVASDHFARLGVNVVDTDILARKIVEPGSPALIELSSVFGDEILSSLGELDRNELRKRAFASDESKAKLDKITHPAIYQEALKQIQASESPYCLVVVPLLNRESAFTSMMDRIVVVAADIETKIVRVEKRSQLSRDEVLQIMNTQLSDEQRAEFADDIIENNSTLEYVYSEVEKLHQTYLKLSQ